MSSRGGPGGSGPAPLPALRPCYTAGPDRGEGVDPAQALLVASSYRRHHRAITTRAEAPDARSPRPGILDAGCCREPPRRERSDRRPPLGRSGDWPKGIISHVSGEPGDTLTVEAGETEVGQEALVGHRLEPAFAPADVPPPSRVESLAHAGDKDHHALSRDPGTPSVRSRGAARSMLPSRPRHVGPRRPSLARLPGRSTRCPMQ